MGKKKIALFVLIFCFVLVTTLPASAQITWEQINSSGFGKPNTRASGLTVFEERLCVGTINQTDGVQVLRYDSNTTWTQVNEDGFGGNNNAAQGIGVFDGDLYVGTTNFSTGCEVWRYDGSATWTQVNVSGFGAGAMVARVFVVFDGKLYAGVRNDTGGDNPEDMVGAQVWRYDGGTNWTQVNQDGFGNVPSEYNRSVETMAVVDGRLYAGTWNDDDGCQVWCYDGGTDWTQVNENGFGYRPSGDEYSVALAMAVLSGKLYVGTRNDANGTKVWRYDGDSSWTQVNVTGFGSANNKAIWNLTEYNGSLYAGTMNMTQGGQVWRYDGGVDWTQVNESGFGNTGNSMVTSMAVLNGQLCAGTDNKTDNCQVWCTANPVADIKANDSNGPLSISFGVPVSITIALDPGDATGQNADWWIYVNTPFASPGDWYSYVYPAGWMQGTNLCIQAPLFNLTPFEVLNLKLPVGNFTFYFAVDDPDGTATGFRGMDSVEVTVE